MSLEFWSNLVITSGATVASSYFGASYAFKLQKSEKEKEEEKSQYSAANRALGILIRQVNNLIGIKTGAIDKYRNHPARFLVIQPLLPRSTEGLIIDYGSLSFLLDTVHRQQLFQILIEEERYIETMNAVNHRSAYHQDIVQPRLTTVGIVEGMEISRENLKSSLGEAIYLTIERSTEQMIESVDSTIESTKKTINESHAIFKKLFPKREFIKATWPE